MPAKPVVYLAVVDGAPVDAVMWDGEAVRAERILIRMAVAEPATTDDDPGA